MGRTVVAWQDEAGQRDDMGGYTAGRGRTKVKEGIWVGAWQDEGGTWVGTEQDMR